MAVEAVVIEGHQVIEIFSRQVSIDSKYEL